MNSKHRSTAAHDSHREWGETPENCMLNVSPDTTRYLIGSKFVDSIEAFKEEIFHICHLMWIHRVELFQLNKEKTELKVLLSFSMDEEWMNTVWQRLVLEDNPNFEYVAKHWKISQINFPWFGIDVAMPIWQSSLIVWFDSKTDNRVFTSSDLLLLKQIGTSIAISYDAGYMTHMSGTDPLLQIWNRLALNHYIDWWVDLFWKQLPKIKIVIFFDIDHFRKFNNDHGHHVGDVILQHTSLIIKRRLAEVSWVLLRYGGEEFVWVINEDWPFLRNDQHGPDTNIFGFIDSIREQVEQSVCQFEWAQHSVTVSVWYAIVRDNENPQEIIREANEAEHTAKITGRNKTVEFKK